MWGFCFLFCIRASSSFPSSSFTLTHSLARSLTHSLTLTHSFTHSLTWQAWDNVHCQGVGCTPWPPSGVPPVSLGLRRRFCVAGVGQCALPGRRMYALASLWRPSGVPWSPPLLRDRRGAMYTPRGSDVRPGVPLASLRCPLVSAAFAWQAWDNVKCQGVGCTPWRPSGVPPVSLGLRRFCVAGVGQCALPGGRMYALASLWRPSGVPWSPPLLRGRHGPMWSGRGSDARPGVPLASLRCPLVSAAFAWQVWDNVHCQGVPPASLRCPLVSSAFAWQAWGNVHCQGVGCTPWRPSGVPPASLRFISSLTNCAHKQHSTGIYKI